MVVNFTADVLAMERPLEPVLTGIPLPSFKVAGNGLTALMPYKTQNILIPLFQSYSVSGFYLIDLLSVFYLIDPLVLFNQPTWTSVCITHRRLWYHKKGGKNVNTFLSNLTRWNNILMPGLNPGIK